MSIAIRNIFALPVQGSTYNYIDVNGYLDFFVRRSLVSLIIMSIIISFYGLINVCLIPISKVYSIYNLFF